MLVETQQRKNNRSLAGKLTKPQDMGNVQTADDWVCLKKKKIKSLIPLVIPGGKIGYQEFFSKENIAELSKKNEKKTFKALKLSESGQMGNQKQIDDNVNKNKTIKEEVFVIDKRRNKENKIEKS